MTNELRSADATAVESTLESLLEDSVMCPACGNDYTPTNRLIKERGICRECCQFYEPVPVAVCMECDKPADAGRFCTYHYVQNKL